MIEVKFKNIIPYVYVFVCFRDVGGDHGNMFLYLGVKDNEGFCLISGFIILSIFKFLKKFEWKQ